MIREYPGDSPEDNGMSYGEIDRFPVSQLTERYGDLARSAVYSRLDALGVKPKRVGNRAYVNAEQLRLLDDLHQFINSGRSTAEFLEIRGLNSATDSSSRQSSEQSSGLSTVSPDIVRLVSMIASEIASRFQPPMPEPDPLAYYETLERAAQQGWLLKTSEVAYLLRLPADEIQQYGDRFSEAGFIFTRAGYRAPGEIAWKVSKPVQ